MRKILVLCCLINGFFVAAQNVINLSGRWDFKTEENSEYNETVVLPGSMLTNNKGNDVSINTRWTGSLYDSSFYFNPYMEKYRIAGQMKFPFFLTPSKHYVGLASYQKTIDIPKSWKKKRIFLYLERPHIETTVYINNQEVGHQKSLSVPHEYEITPYIISGKKNIITIKVYNGIENVCVGQDSHSVTDQTQGNWNGIAGRIELQARPKYFIEQVQVTPDLKEHKAHVKLYINNNTSPKELRRLRNNLKDKVYLKAELTNSTRKHVITSVSNLFFDNNGCVNVDLSMSDSCQLWDEFNPSYYQLSVVYSGDTIMTQFGMREINVNKRQIMLNGHPIWLRGTVENCCFPQTGYPPTDVESWIKIFAKCKEYGLNHIRFHSYCPPEAAFYAADMIGLYLQPEGPSWPNHGVKLRSGMIIDQYLLDESKQIVRKYGNHPSFVMMAAGNEPAGNWVAYCNDWVKTMHQYDPTKIYCGASVGGGWAWDNGSEYHVKGGARGLDWDNHIPHSDNDYYTQIEFPRNYKDEKPNQSPIVAHEQGQWCAFPDFKEIEQYESCAYKPRNFEIFRDLLSDNGMEEQAEKFLYASGKLQVLAYKYELESNLRTKDYAGFQLLGLNDYSGQGTALVGPLNVFWKEKQCLRPDGKKEPYINAKEWHDFCSEIVPLARFTKFVYQNNESIKIPVEVYNASGNIVPDVLCYYTITDENNHEYKHENLPLTNLLLGKNIDAGTVDFNLEVIKSPKKLVLTTYICCPDKRTFKNHWEFWVYENGSDFHETRIESAPNTIYETDTLDEKAKEILKNGGDVLLCAAGKIRFGKDVKHHYLPVFWNTSWFKMRPPHTTGAYISKEHPIFNDFPTDNWQNINWWELTNKVQVMNLSEFPDDYQPIVQPIDTWHISRKLGMLIEAKVLNGRVILTTMDIRNNLSQRVVARQLRKSVINYMNSDRFHPQYVISPEIITNLFENEAPPVNMFTKDSPDELKPKIK